MSRKRFIKKLRSQCTFRKVDFRFLENSYRNFMQTVEFDFLRNYNMHYDAIIATLEQTGKLPQRFTANK